MVYWGFIFCSRKYVYEGLTKGEIIFNRHQHKWEEKERFFAHGLDKYEGRGFFEQEEIERMMLGVTTILYKCECGQVKTVEILGNSKNAKD